MATNRFVTIGAALLIECSRKVNQKGITGLTVNLTIQRDSDDAYWTGSTWGSLTVLTMTPTDAVNKPGLYSYSGPTPEVADTYFCHAYIASGQYAFEEDETITIIATPSKAGDAMALTDAAFEPNRAASINAQVLDVLAVDVIAELTADPGATPTLIKAIQFLFMKARNKEEITDTSRTVTNDAGTTILTHTITDNGVTLTKSKVA
jgi:hypothetical protein